MGAAQPMNVMDVWAKRDEIRAEEHAKTLMSTLEVLELIDPQTKRKLPREKRRALQSELDKMRIKVKGLLAKGQMLQAEIDRRAAEN